VTNGLAIEPGGLGQDTILEETNSGYRAYLNPDWRTYGPCGGYLAAIALRAAGLSARRARPVSISCTFLRAAKFGPVDVAARPSSSGMRATSVAVALSQDDRLFMEASVWAIDDGLRGMEHDASPIPEVTMPDDLEELDTRTPPERPRPFPEFRRGVEERTLTYDFELERRPVGDPCIRSWFRFRPVPSFDDPFVDGGRMLLLLDTFQFPAAAAAHQQLPPYFARSLDLVVHFHNIVKGQDWLLCEATSPVSGGGLVSGRNRIWGQDGHLLASGGQQMLCSRIPGR
jgi:acyl-CoA thioesterase